MTTDGATINEMRSGNGQLLLVRHTQIADDFVGLCYGASDVPLSAAGESHARKIAISLCEENPSVVVHSGLARARYLAEEVARLVGVDVVCDPRLQELNFGAWELRSWDDIFTEVGHGMSRLILEPDTLCAPGAESANQVLERMLSWIHEIGHSSLETDHARAGCVGVEQACEDRVVVAVSHGVQISALRGAIEGHDAASWPDIMPGYGEVLRLDLPVVLPASLQV